VDPNSAIQQGTKETNQYPVNKDHSTLVKFTENDDALGPILHFMQPNTNKQRLYGSYGNFRQNDHQVANTGYETNRSVSMTNGTFPQVDSDIASGLTHALQQQQKQQQQMCMFCRSIYPCSRLICKQ
jgi:hypothetical protein